MGGTAPWWYHFPVPLPATVASQLIRELAERLNDPSAPMAPGELRAALAQLRRAQRNARAEDLAAVFDAIGVVCGRLGEFKEALDAHKNAARYDTSRATYLTNAACCLIALERFPEALACLRDANARPQKSQLDELLILISTAEIHRHLGNHNAARIAFEEALLRVDPASSWHLFAAASAAANLGADEDAVELFARSMAVARGVDLGETPAIEFLRTSPGHMKAAPQSASLEAALARVAARHDAPIPPEHQLVTQISLPPAALTALDELVEHPPDPTESLRQLFDEPRA